MERGKDRFASKFDLIELVAKYQLTSAANM
jgi:hypothetical protein